MSKVRVYLLVIMMVSVGAILRIASLGTHESLPRLSSHQDGHYDYEGVIHWHTGYSGDAQGTYEQIAEIGNQQHLDFLITTEHNNLLALHEHKEGWHGGMLTLVGVESTRKEGYLLGLNLRSCKGCLGTTDNFLLETSRQGGFVIIAHPRNPRWPWRGKIAKPIEGQEIVDLTDQFTTASPLAVLSGVLYYPWNTSAGFMQVYHRPVETLKMWDDENSRRPFVGIYAPDVHQAIRINGRNIFRFPKAENVLPIAHDHVILPMPFTGDFSKDKPMLYDAVRKGRIYIAVDSLGDATGFFFSARQNNRTGWMGDQLLAGVKTYFWVVAPKNLAFKESIINVYHNGKKIAQGTGLSYSFQAMLPGSYRIEVEVNIPTFWGLGKRVIWIYSNPIYLR